jgi:hypothetical protein
MSMAKTRFRRCIQLMATCLGTCCSGGIVFCRAQCARRGEYAVKASEVRTRRGHEGGEAGEKVQRLEQDVGGAVAIDWLRCLRWRDAIVPWRCMTRQREAQTTPMNPRQSTGSYNGCIGYHCILYAKLIPSLG